jgi:two-component system, LytTR family, response regulator
MENPIRFRDSTGFVHLAPEEILRLEGDGNYTQVVLADGRKFLLSKTISHLLGRIPNGMLLRISKSHAINPVYLESVFLRHRQRYVCLSSGEKLEISRRKATEMRKKSKKS